MKYLIIAGHGKLRNGGFDPGATGLISKGEHRYMKENLFPAMKKYVGSDFIFFDKYKVLDYGNVVSLARKYGKDTAVIEVHFDAASEAARGGHVIVYSHFKPDAMDLRLRDAIKSMTGVRYSHAGHKGIDGRSNLGNINRTASNGVNYRLIELGFGTNRTDSNILLNKTDEYAKKLVEAIKGGKVSGSSTPIKPSEPVVKSINDMADEVEGGLHGNGHAQRQKSLGVDNATYAKVRAEVNRRAKGTPKPSPKKTISIMANEILAGKHGNGHANRRASLGVSQSEYNKVKAEVNRLSGVKPKPKQSIEQMANRILTEKGVPNGHEARRKWLKVDNATYQKVRSRVNQKLS